MDTAKAKRALKKLAKQKGISEKEIRREMEIAIAEAMTNPEPQAQAFWKSIPIGEENQRRRTSLPTSRIG